MESLDKKVGLFTTFISWLPSPLKIALYRMLGAKIGRNVSIGIGAVIVARSFKNVKIGDYSCIDNFSMIICDRIEMGEACHIGPFVWVYGGSLLWMIPRECTFRIGDMTYVGARSVINVTEDVSIGNYAGIGAGTTIYTHGFQASYIDGEPRKEAPVSVGDRAWVQPKTFIIPGVSIGNDSIVGSASVVTKDIPPGVFAVGCPASVKSEVSKLKKGNSFPEREERTLKVIADYLEAIKYFKKDKVEIMDKGANVWGLALKKKLGLSRARYTLIYVAGAEGVDAKDLKGEGTRILICLKEMPQEKGKELSSEGIVWIDISKKLVSDRERLPPFLYMFLRDYYGVGLLTA